jgi:diaminopimelate decarboxylase
LAAQHGTPLMVFNRDRLITDAARIKSAMEKKMPGSMVLYSYKTTPIPGVLAELHRVGLGAEVISPYELWLACKLGVPGEKIVYNGVNKDFDSLVQAVKHGVLAINVDAVEEVAALRQAVAQVGCKANVGIRLAMNENSQFGLSLQNGEAFEIAKLLASEPKNFNFNCIHFNATSGARHSQTHIHYALKALDFMKALQAETQKAVPYLDIGGGIGVPTSKQYSGLEFVFSRALQLLPVPPDTADFEEIESFVDNVGGHIEKRCLDLQIPVPKIIIEPGRFVTSRAGILLTQIRSRKELPMDFQYLEIFDVNRAHARRDKSFSIVGRVCTSADWTARMKLLPADLCQGDILAIMDAGAYFTAFSNSFAFPRPPIILVDKEGAVQEIRRRETFADMVGCDTMASRY